PGKFVMRMDIRGRSLRGGQAPIDSDVGRARARRHCLKQWHRRPRRLRMSSAISIPPMLAKVAGRWQVPLLTVSLGVMGTGLSRVIIAYQPVSFEEETARVALLRETGHHDRAWRYLTDRLRNT